MGQIDFYPQSISRQGTLDYVQVVTNQTGITTDVDLTNLTVTITTTGLQRIKITAVADSTSDVANDTMRLNIKEGAVILGWSRLFIDVAGRSSTHAPAFAVLIPSAGSHTYKLSMVRETGTGTGIMVASGNNPAFILVEDIS